MKIDLQLAGKAMVSIWRAGEKVSKIIAQPGSQNISLEADDFIENERTGELWVVTHKNTLRKLKRG